MSWKTLAADDALPIRVDAYLALNFGDEFFGDWYTDHERGPVATGCASRGEIHLDDGAGRGHQLGAGRPDRDHRPAGPGRLAVSVHTVSTEAQDLVLDAFEAALGATAPKSLHHRIEHAIEVNDEQLARMVAWTWSPSSTPTAAGRLGAVERLMGQGPEYPPDQIGWLTRSRDFADAGLQSPPPPMRPGSSRTSP